MNCFYHILLIFSLTSLSIAEPAKRPRTLQERYSECLVKSIERVKKDYARILARYEELAKASPAEHPYYLNRLKCEIIESVEQNQLPLYKSMAIRCFNAVITNRVYRVPLEQFKREYVDDAIYYLNFPASKAKGHPSVPEAERLIRQFREMRRVLS